MSKLHFCTVASTKKNGLKQLLKSCRENKIDLQVLGFEKPFRGFCEKFIQMLEYIKTLNDEDIILFTDAYDSLVLSNEKTILEKFFSMQSPFVISCEKNCWPDKELSALYPATPFSFRYINTGSYIGYVGFLKRYFQTLMPFKAEDNDQRLITLDYLKHPEKYTLDTSCKIFLPTWGIESTGLSIDQKKRSVFCFETQNSPCIIHGNGNSPWYQYIYDCLFDEIYSQKKNAGPIETKSIFLAILASNASIVIQKYLNCIDNLMYNKKLITIGIYTYDNQDETESILQDWANSRKNLYKEIFTQKRSYGKHSNPWVFTPESFLVPEPLLKESIDFAKASGADSYFTIGVYNFITPFALKELLSQKKPCISPLLHPIPVAYDKPCNFDGFADEKDIISHKKIGAFKVKNAFGTFLLDLKQQECAEYYISNQKRFGLMIYFSKLITEEQQDALHQFLYDSSIGN